MSSKSNVSNPSVAFEDLVVFLRGFEAKVEVEAEVDTASSRSVASVVEEYNTENDDSDAADAGGCVDTISRCCDCG